MKQEASTQAAFRDQKEWFATFLRYSNQKDVQRKTTLRGLKKDFPSLWNRIKDKNYSFSAVFVGAGTGGLEIPLMQDFQSTRGTSEKIAVFCEDPSPQMKEGFHDAAKEAAVDTQLKEYSLSSFDNELYQPPKADIALASHVWYYIQNWRETPAEKNTLQKFANILRPSGVGLITLYSKTSDRYLLLSNFASLSGVDVESPGEDVLEELNKLAIKHHNVIVESQTDISTVFKNEIFAPNAEGKMLLSFLLRAAWEDQPPSTQDRIAENIVALVQKNARQELILRDCYIWLSPC